MDQAASGHENSLASSRLMAIMGPMSGPTHAPTSDPADGKYTALLLDLGQLGKVRLAQLLSKNTETQIYFTDRPGVLVKMFDLSCDREDEVAYGPYLAFGLELANFEDVQKIEDLRPCVPSYYGAAIDYQSKFAFIAMEHVQGRDLRVMAEGAASAAFLHEWVEEFREAVFETLAIVRRFHRHGIVLIDFKPDHVLRYPNRGLKLVDLGALFTPRQSRELEKYVYSATPDHAEVVIDAPNVQSGIPLTETSDIFSAGVALFEIATGSSRLSIEPQTADEILNDPGTYRHRDTQIRDVWKSYPTLEPVLPLLEAQLRERRVLFAEVWHLLRGYLGHRVEGWASLPGSQQDQILLSTGTTFIMEQLPAHLQWLAGPIAQATVFRSLRVKNVSDLMQLLEKPVADHVLESLRNHNSFVRLLEDSGVSTGFIDRLNSWQVRAERRTGHWTIAATAAAANLPGSAELTFLRTVSTDEQGHRYYQTAEDLDADDYDGGKLTLWHLRHDRFAWI